MAKLQKALKRERKNHKNRHGIRTGGRSVFTIQQEQIKRARKIKNEQNEN